MKGFFGGILTLIVLQVFSSGRGPDAGGKLVGWIGQGVNKALSPDIALIPTAKKAPPAKAAGKPSTGGIDLPRNPSLGTIQA